MELFSAEFFISISKHRFSYTEKIYNLKLNSIYQLWFAYPLAINQWKNDKDFSITLNPFTKIIFKYCLGMSNFISGTVNIDNWSVFWINKSAT